MKTAKDFMQEADAVVPRMSAEDAIAKYNAGEGVFIDVRDSGAIAQSGTIKNAHRIARGMIEFVADPATAYHNDALQKDAHLYLICGAGGQAALAGHTLKSMGFENVTHIGGFAAWKEADGPVED